MADDMLAPAPVVDRLPLLACDLGAELSSSPQAVSLHNGQGRPARAGDNPRPIANQPRGSEVTARAQGVEGAAHDGRDRAGGDKLPLACGEGGVSVGHGQTPRPARSAISHGDRSTDIRRPCLKASQRVA